MSPKPLEGLLNDAGVKNGSALNFITAMFQVWFKNDKAANIASMLRKAGLATRYYNTRPLFFRVIYHWRDVYVFMLYMYA